jgi:hypothetical protein
MLALAMSGPVLADPNPQLVASVQTRLAGYGFHVDVSQFATSTVAALHLTLSGSDGYLKKRRELKNILRKARYK